MKKQEKCCQNCFHWTKKYSIQFEGLCQLHGLNSYRSDRCREWESENDDENTSES